MSALRGVGTRLALALLIVVAGALAVVYAIVVPSLESRLVDSHVAELKRAAGPVARGLPESFLWDDYVEGAAATTNARVTLFIVYGPPPTLLPQADSLEARPLGFDQDEVALRAATTGAPAQGAVTRDGERFAEAAAPVPGTRLVVLLSSSLEDAYESVGLVRTRLLIGGGLALLAALAVGYGGAWLFARRLRRLERAAERIASGRFDEPIADRGSDEVGQLSRAFDSMRERLSALDRARSEFIANASHELRTPLFALGGSVELLRDDELDGEARREFLDTIGEQVQRLTKLAEELLDLSRLDAGRIAVEREPVDLAELGETLVEEFGPFASREGHPLRLAANGPAQALADPQRVLQIGRILVENALVHTPPGTRVRVAVQAENGTASIVVEDAGSGIAPEETPHVFERFYRGSRSKASGSGLGLAIASELARLMEGALDVESRPGRTAFRLRLPAVVQTGNNDGGERS